MRPLSLLLLLTACGDKDSQDTAATEEADTDTDTDSDTDTDVGACPSWIGISRAGTGWAYEYTGEVTGTSTSAVTGYSDSTGEVEITSESSVAAEGYSSESTSVSDYLCDGDGMWLLGTYTEYSGEASGFPYSGTSTITYDEPALLMPGSLSAGDTWTSTSSGTVESSEGGGAQSFSSSTAYEVVAEESVTVAAGTYATLKISSAVDGGGAAVMWYADGVGTVKGDGYELTSHTP